MKYSILFYSILFYSILISSCVDENDSILENQNQVELNGEKLVSFLKQY